MRPQINLILLLFLCSCDFNKDQQNFIELKSVISQQLSIEQDYSILKNDFLSFLEEDYDLFNKFLHHLNTIGFQNLDDEHKSDYNKVTDKVWNRMMNLDSLKQQLKMPGYYDPKKEIEYILASGESTKVKQISIDHFLNKLSNYYKVGKILCAEARAEDFGPAIENQKSAYNFLKNYFSLQEPGVYTAEETETVLLLVKDFLAFCESRRVFGN